MYLQSSEPPCLLSVWIFPHFSKGGMFWHMHRVHLQVLTRASDTYTPLNVRVGKSL
jgi:hypothetical protein